MNKILAFILAGILVAPGAVQALTLYYEYSGGTPTNIATYRGTTSYGTNPTFTKASSSAGRKQIGVLNNVTTIGYYTVAVKDNGGVFHHLLPSVMIPDTLTTNLGTRMTNNSTAAVRRYRNLSSVASRATATVETDIANSGTQGVTLNGYQKANFEDTGDVDYTGFINNYGEWYIIKHTASTGVYIYAKGVSGYSTNWTSRASLTYTSWAN